MGRIYLDNAATSWPKPPNVLQAVARYHQELGSPAGRSAYTTASEVDRHVAQVRRRVAEFFGATSPMLVAFTAGCTDGLNLVLQSLREWGGHVITTSLEHNSVLRPLKHLEQANLISVTRLEVSPEKGVVTPEQVRNAWRPETKLVAITHASNVLGTVQPVREIADIVHAAGGRMLLDAAQTAGHFPCTLANTGADYLVTAAHKGLMGILGLGILICKDEQAAAQLTPLRFGGTGSKSDLDEQPADLPDRFEAGSPNLPAIFALGAGLAFVEKQSVAKLQQRAHALTRQTFANLTQTPGIEVYGPEITDNCEERVGVISFNLAGVDPRELATIIDSAANVEARAGMHCAPLLHRSLGTAEAGGALRFSVGSFTTADEINQACEVIAEVAREMAVS